MVSEVCIFCQIIEGNIPSNKIGESDDLLAFHDVAPAAPTHILIVPKVHFASVAELESQSPTLAHNMLVFAHKLAQIVGVVITCAQDISAQHYSSLYLCAKKIPTSLLVEIVKPRLLS